MIVRLVCVLASSSCIGTEPAAYVPENVESENTDFRAVTVHSKFTKFTVGFVVCSVGPYQLVEPQPKAKSSTVLSSRKCGVRAHGCRGRALRPSAGLCATSRQNRVCGDRPLKEA